MDKNSNGGVKVRVTLHFFLKTEMTHFHSPKKKEGACFILTGTNDSFNFLSWSYFCAVVDIARFRSNLISPNLRIPFWLKRSTACLFFFFGFCIATIKDKVVISSYNYRDLKLATRILIYVHH